MRYDNVPFLMAIGMALMLALLALIFVPHAHGATAPAVVQVPIESILQLRTLQQAKVDANKAYEDAEHDIIAKLAQEDEPPVVRIEGSRSLTLSDSNSCVNCFWSSYGGQSGSLPAPAAGKRWKPDFVYGAELTADKSFVVAKQLPVLGTSTYPITINVPHDVQVKP